MSKAQILAAVRKGKPPELPLPPAITDGLRYPDPVTKFADVLRGVGGQSVLLATDADLPAAIGQRYPDANVIYSLVPSVPGHGFTPPADGDPHAFERLDLSVVHAAFGVAENGAVWLSTAQVQHPVCLFITQHLAVVLSRRAIVHNLHEAYARLATEPVPRFGLFLSGPSKTADIEQCLVIGVHGARSLTVFLAE